jgi:uncharacterized protein
MTPIGDGQVPLEARVLSLWRIRAGSTLAVVCLVVGVVVGLAASVVAAAIVVSVLAAAGGVTVWWWTALVWRAWRFSVGPDALHLDHGVLTRRSSTIPYHRVQHIDLEAGPLERRFRLTTLVLRTASASSDSTVPGIDANDAETVRSRILARVGTGDAT